MLPGLAVRGVSGKEETPVVGVCGVVCGLAVLGVGEVATLPRPGVCALPGTDGL